MVAEELQAVSHAWIWNQSFYSYFQKAGYANMPMSLQVCMICNPYGLIYRDHISYFHCATDFYYRTLWYGKGGLANKKRQRGNQRDSGRDSAWNNPENECVASVQQADPLYELSSPPRYGNSALLGGTGRLVVTAWQQDPWVIKAALCFIPVGQVCPGSRDHTWPTHTQQKLRQFSTSTNILFPLCVYG